MTEERGGAGDLVFKAIEFAARAHSGQYRKGTKLPYIIHPLNVGRLLIEAGAEEAVVAAGILHDTIEDAKTPVETIRAEFGDRVAELVAAVSEPEKSEPWEARKQALLGRLAAADAGVLLVEAGDKLDNIRAIRADYEALGDGVWSRFNRPRASQRWYYQSLARAFGRRAELAAAAGLFDAFAREVERVFGAISPADEPPPA